MKKPTLHVIGIFHTVTNQQYSHCAFTGKVLKFGKMMTSKGYEVIEYSNGKSESKATEHVKILEEDNLNRMKSAWFLAGKFVNHEAKDKDAEYMIRVQKSYSILNSGDFEQVASSFHGDSACISSPHWDAFDSKLKVELAKRVKDGDIICHPFGRAHTSLLSLFPKCFHVETGIGYPDEPFGCYRIFETYNWMSWHQGRDRRNGRIYEWVVPNYFDVDEWTFNQGKGQYYLYFGRICQEKGLQIVKELSLRLKEKVLIVGQGDPSPYLTDYIEYRKPVHGRERDSLLGNAKALLMPTQFTEPFGGAGVEGMLCGSPLIASDFGAFAETVEHGKTGFRCHTLGDYVEACKRATGLDRKYISDRARSLYSQEACAKKYDDIFMQLSELYQYEGGPKPVGWYTDVGRL